MENRLKAAAEAGDIDIVYALIEENPYLLDRVDDIPFVETPLHVAASLGHTKFAMEMMRLKPSFAKKPDVHGLTPLHLASQHGRKETARRLVDIDAELVRVKGREGKTPLHFAAEEGDIDLLTSFLSACPPSIQDMTIRNQTALHIAVKNCRFDAFDVLIGRLRRVSHKGSLEQETKILDAKDEDGNTALHVAALTNQPQVIRVLIDCRSPKINAKNLEGLTALDISQLQSQLHNNEAKKILRRAGALTSSELDRSTPAVEDDCLRSKISFAERVAISFLRYKNSMTNGVRNVQLVVAVLIATATYQAALSPPGGVWQDNNSNNTAGGAMHRAGTVIMNSGTFLLFWIFNTTALLTTTLAILFLLPSGFISTLLFPPLFIFSYCYALSMSIVSPNSFAANINYYLLISLSVLVILVLLFFFRVSRKLDRFSLE